MTEPTRQSPTGRTGTDFRILDKDLGRLTHAEAARFHAARPVLGLGAAALFVVAVTLVALGVFAGQPGLATIGAGMVVASYLALSIGANDVANALGPAYGAGAVGLTTGLVLVAVAEIAGALLAGNAVSSRLATGIVAPAAAAAGTGEAPAQMMTAALLAAAIWISAATRAGIPVSTTHAIVGGIAGAGLVAFGAGAVSWGAIATMAGGWMVAPVISGLTAAAILAFIRARVGQAPDRAQAARRWLPGMIALMAALFLIWLGRLVLGLPWGPLLMLATLTGLAGGWHARFRLDAQIRAHARTAPALKHMFAIPLLWAAALMGFAHGANDVGNVAAPLSVILQGAGLTAAPGADQPGIAPVALMAAGGGIALGALLFGRRLVAMIGTGITRLNAIRAFCVTLATAATVLTASTLGLPVSTTHVAVGGVFGVGFFREWQDRRRGPARARMPAAERRRRVLVRRSHVATILSAWVITLPVTAALAAVLKRLIALMGG